MGAVARHWGVVVSRRGQNGGPQGRAHEYKSFFVGLRLSPGIGAWSSPGGGRMAARRAVPMSTRVFLLACGCCPTLGPGRLPAGGRMAARRAILISTRVFLLACGCCPALGRGRLPAGGRGQGLAQPLAPYDPQPRVGAATSDGQHGNARRTIGLLSAARQRAFGLPLSRARAGRASVRRRSFRPFRGGDLLRVLPRLRQQAESLFLPCKRGVIP